MKELVLDPEIIAYEMLTHPALFAHQAAERVAVIDSTEAGFLQEIVKHTSLKEIWQVHQAPLGLAINDARVQSYSGDSQSWLTHSAGRMDVIIRATAETHHLSLLLNALTPQGILIQLGENSFALSHLLATHQQLLAAGFADIQILNFPHTKGWRSAFMAIKKGHFKRVSEKKIYNKNFPTQYYNFDIHKASMVLPECLRTSLIT